MQYLICEKESGIIEALSDNITISEEDSSMFYDASGDCYYSNGEFVYYEFPSDDIPKYIHVYDYRYFPSTGFSRTFTRAELLEQRQAMSKAANLKTETLEEIKTQVSTIHSKVYNIVNTDAMSLEEYKTYKIAESKTLLATFLEEHPITSTAHNGVAGIYSVTEEKQNLLMSNYLSYQIELLTNPEAVLTWNETGKSCEVWKLEEFLQLVLEIKNYVKSKIEIQQHYEELITSATSKDEIDAIILSYEDVQEEVDTDE